MTRRWGPTTGTQAGRPARRNQDQQVISKKMMSATGASIAERTEVAAILAHAGGYCTLSKAAIHGAEQDAILLDDISNADQ